MLNITLKWNDELQVWVLEDNMYELGTWKQMYDNKDKAEKVYNQLVEYYTNKEMEQ